ncbi:hypothetical protein [Acidipropionibacterium virtanenii]|uniref:Uncharacterized protein n=1 Tax=Acidipropionibacterium virtanenii TaxID=2057246 RepID=A0A344UQZ9_9ACTN|nr:hypothetical protein [Acidipropionibacterium virtanenii]AXE37697.1 hypothetical protein JS278_00504 [Acidipropionibacterium virtanenii]
MKIVISGGLNSAMTHFAMIGLAGILEEAGAERVRLGWTVEGAAEAVVTWNGPDAGEAVKAHATRHADEGSWVQAKGADSATGLFSPRIKPPRSTAGWIDLESRREEFLGSDLTELDALFLSNLGEPGYWVVHNNELQPDRAASRWEMKTRNRGEEFVGKRLAPLADVVANRSTLSIIEGLTGASVTDTVGKNSPESRTSTGLTRPGPADDVLAWCGLWGISGFALVPAVSRVSATACASPLRTLHTKRALIPVLDRMVSPAAWRAVVASQAVNGLPSPDEERVSAALLELPLMGVIGACDFTVHKGGSSSAPERMILSGEFHPLEYFSPWTQMTRFQSA